MALFSRSTPDLPGHYGTLRDCSPTGKGLKKFQAGDIAVINAADTSRQEAQALIDVSPTAVINAAAFSTGQLPNHGALMLCDAGILLIDNVGPEFLQEFKDGKKARISDEGEIYLGDKPIGSGAVLSREIAEERFSEAQSNLIAHMESYFGNTIEFIHSESLLLIDGLGIPEVGAEMAGRKVLLVSPSADYQEKISGLRNFIREYEPYIIGVAQAADFLLEVGYEPDLIVGRPHDMSDEALKSGARIIVPADPDGTVIGIERIHDLGVGAMTFPAATDSATDLALLLAEYHEARMIVQVGDAIDLDSVFANASHATPSALLSRMKAGRKLVDADAVIDLYTTPAGGGMAWLWALLGILVALAVIIAVVGFGGAGDFTSNLSATWSNILNSIRGIGA